LADFGAGLGLTLGFGFDLFVEQFGEAVPD
jgi:hypothetical protein